MQSLAGRIEPLLRTLPLPVAVRLPDGLCVGAADPAVMFGFDDWTGVASMVTGCIGKVAELYVEGRIELRGSPREIMAVGAALLREAPVDEHPGWWERLWRLALSVLRHSPTRDARQIEFHYDVSDDFYALWLDPRRVYSCAYYRDASMSLAQAQEAKLELICRKLMLQPGERFLDVGAGWGALLLWAAEHHGVDATGITLSRNQHAYVDAAIRARGLQDRVRMELRDYRSLDETRPFDKIASVGMFEHVGQVNMPGYFAKLRDLLAPGGLLMNHGITAAGVQGGELGAGMGRFIEKYIFPGGELLHVSQALRDLGGAGLELLDAENLRPHYARTLWAWSDALEAEQDRARRILRAQGDDDRAEHILRAYRLYLAGCALAFEQGWVSLHQLLAARPTGRPEVDARTRGWPKGAQSPYPFNREYIYR